MAKKISILGCGWLGLPLAKALLQQDWHVKGSTTTSSKLGQLVEAGIDAYEISCNPVMTINHGDQEKFFSTDVLVVTVPFRRSFDDPRYYVDQIYSIIDAAIYYKVPHVLFSSSTSIYPTSNQEVTEETGLHEINDRAQALYEIEQAILNHDAFKATVVRCAGLYGGERRIGQFLAGKKKYPHGEAPVNLIHQDDVVNIFLNIINQQCWGEVFNACSDAHPTRRELYTRAAYRMGLPIPTFLEGTGNYKIVNNTKVKEKLGYVFKHSDPLNDI